MNSIEPTKKTESSKIVLEILLGEYEDEKSRKNTLEVRAGIFLTVLVPFVVAILTGLKPNIDFPIENNINLLFSFIQLLALLIAGISVFFTFKYLMSTLSTCDYLKIDINEFTDKVVNNQEYYVNMILIKRYITVINNSREINNKKSQNYMKALNSIMWFIGSIIVFFVVLKLL